jgi:ribonuclease VapC
MTKRFVLDSSAVLAVINLEPGCENVEPKFPDAVISNVNVAEILTKLAERKVSLKAALGYFLKVGLDVADFDVSLALETARLRPLTKHLGLSLGDRACLALAIRENATAVTADRSWTGLDVCPIEAIR